jgi:hypothetical protein
MTTERERTRRKRLGRVQEISMRIIKLF